jgi:hypothetical protein
MDERQVKGKNHWKREEEGVAHDLASPTVPLSLDPLRVSQLEANRLITLTTYVVTVRDIMRDMVEVWWEYLRGLRDVQARTKWRTWPQR